MEDIHILDAGVFIIIDSHIVFHQSSQMVSYTLAMVRVLIFYMYL